jgi:hypothetical protein
MTAPSDVALVDDAPESAPPDVSTSWSPDDAADPSSSFGAYAAPDLGALLANRSWHYHRLPFPHFTATDVFVPWLHDELTEAYRDVLARGVCERGGDPSQFSRRMIGYDAYSYEIRRDPTSPFSLFISPPWMRLISDMCQVATNPDVQIALHHHAPDSKNGWIHADLVPGWFIDRPAQDGVNLPDRLCNYKNGKTLRPDIPARESARAISVIYFLANPDWVPEHGGETGLYAAQTDPVESPARRIPPRNNSILVFECTPFSFHAFLNNFNVPRNSLIQWLHRPVADVIERWGEKSVDKWRKPTSAFAS